MEGIAGEEAKALVFTVGNVLMKELLPLGILPGKVPIKITHILPGKETQYSVSQRPSKGIVGRGVMTLTSIVKSPLSPFFVGQVVEKDGLLAVQFAKLLYERLVLGFGTIHIKVLGQIANPNEKGIMNILSRGGGCLGNVQIKKTADCHVVTFEVLCSLLVSLTEEKVYPFQIAPIQVEWRCGKDCCKRLKQYLFLDCGIRVGQCTVLEAKVPMTITCQGKKRTLLLRNLNKKMELPDVIGEEELFNILKTNC